MLELGLIDTYPAPPPGDYIMRIPSKIAGVLFSIVAGFSAPQDNKVCSTASDLNASSCALRAVRLVFRSSI